MRQTASGDEGAVLVEAALVLPVLLALVLGLMDFGLAVLQSTQASGAARDGARLAILSPAGADVPGSPTNAAIRTEVQRRLAGQVVDSVTVSCRRPGGATVTCASARPEVDAVEVAVRWNFRPIGPIGGAFGPDDISSTSRMVIVGSRTVLSPTPTTTAPPGATTTTTTAPPGATTTTTVAPPTVCQVTNLTAQPDPVRRQSGPAAHGRRLSEDLTFTVTTNGSPACAGILVFYRRGAEDTQMWSTQPTLQADGVTFRVLIRAASHNDWTVGTKALQARLDGVPLRSTTFSVVNR